MAQVTAGVRWRARLHAEKVRRGSIVSRRAVTAARMRRLHERRPFVHRRDSRVHASLRVGSYDWSDCLEGSALLDRARTVREQALLLRRDADVLRGAMSWETRRLRRTTRDRHACLIPWSPLPEDDFHGVFD